MSIINPEMNDIIIKGEGKPLTSLEIYHKITIILISTKKMVIAV